MQLNTTAYKEFSNDIVERVKKLENVIEQAWIDLEEIEAINYYIWEALTHNDKESLNRAQTLSDCVQKLLKNKINELQKATEGEV